MSDTLAGLEVLTSPSQIGSTWLQQEKLSTHMSGYPRHAASRSSWRGQHERVFVRIRTADGRVGVGATRGTATVAVIVDHLAGLLRGRSLAEADQLYRELTASQLTYGWSGVGAAALSAIDLALWDLRAQHAGVALGALLSDGDPVRESLPCYVTVHPEHLDGLDGLDGVKIAARFGPDDGPGAARRVAQDVTRVRDAVAPGTLVMIDAACSWTAEFTDAVLGELTDGQLDWLEDPLLPWDARGYESIKKRVAGWSHAPRLCLGNYAFSALEAHQVLAEGVVDVIQPDLTWAGGLTAAREIHRDASARGVGFSPHYGAMHPWAVQLLATLPQAEPAEFVTTSGSGSREDYPGLPVPVHGRQTVPTGVGAAAALGPEVEQAARTQTVDLTR
ncbi:L-lyxonate dehydratase [Promicromonospora xylanilytica]